MEYCFVVFIVYFNTVPAELVSKIWCCCNPPEKENDQAKRKAVAQIVKHV